MGAYIVIFVLSIVFMFIAGSEKCSGMMQFFAGFAISSFICICIGIVSGNDYMTRSPLAVKFFLASFVASILFGLSTNKIVRYLTKND